MGSERGWFSRDDERTNVVPFQGLSPELNTREVEDNRARTNRETLEYLGGNALTAAEIENISKRAGW